MLDLHGINHDPRLWQDPASFHPPRFLNWRADRYAFVPQGGGDHEHQHRCPGEWITVELMRAATEFLTREVHYHVPKQDLRVDDTRLPALPRSRFVIAEVRLRPAQEDQSSSGSASTSPSRSNFRSHSARRS
jgi:fatty-acid peroxygenase